jgi:hypothetical protein
MANVVVRTALRLTWSHWQQWLRTVERLNLRFLVDAEHQCALWRRQVGKRLGGRVTARPTF